MKNRRRGGNQAVSTASGLRPASAFVAVGTVLLAVSGKAAHLAFFAPGTQPEPVAEVTAPWPKFEVTDRFGRALAISIECFDVTTSPRALWRTHTPDRIANMLAAEFMDESGADILARMLPAPPVGEPAGLVRVAVPRLLRFEADAAERVDGWISTGGLEEGEGPLDGIWLWPLGDDTFTLEWAPAIALSEDARLRHLGKDLAGRPDLWTRRLLGELGTLVEEAHAGDLPQEIARRLAGLSKNEQRAALRDAIWA
ncbi:MAG: hypothetical protein O2816_04885, partial [Planctomycetota bacterium]|nr:hypothetical protein [Planctomycetota bacterium]